MTRFAVAIEAWAATLGWRLRRWARAWVEPLTGPVLFPIAVIAGLAAFLASRMAAVGLVVNTGAVPGTSTAVTNAEATYFVAGLTERGDTVAPVLIRSMSEYDTKLGSRVTYGTLYDDLAQFFAEGGERAYVARLVGPGATKGTRTLNATGGGGAATIVLTAQNAGAWSANLSVEVIAGAIANTFTVRLYLNGALVEAFYECTSPADAVAKINNGSALVTAADSANVTAAPGNNPAVLAASALSAGTDDRGSLVAADYVTALARFDFPYGTGAVAIPGQTATAVGAGVIAHCVTYRRVGLLAPAIAQSVAAVQTVANSLRTTSGSEFAGLFYPWVKVPDGAGGTRTISPEGYVAGCRARAIRTAGTWQAPAGAGGTAAYLVDVEGSTLTAANINDLADSRVNPIIRKAGGIRLYGWRSLSQDQVNYKVLTARDTLNMVSKRVEDHLEQFVFATVDGRGALFSRISGELAGILDPIRVAGGLYESFAPGGARIDPGYVIDCGPDVNTDVVLGAGQVKANVAVRLSPTAELITVTVTKVALGVAL